MAGSSSPAGIIHANIIRRAFTAHLMFHERAEWILHTRVRAWKIFEKNERQGKKAGPNFELARISITLLAGLSFFAIDLWTLTRITENFEVFSRYCETSVCIYS